MSERRFAELWERFASVVVPADACEAQKRDTRNAFYSGGLALLELMGALDEGAEPTEKDERMIQGVLEELRDFMVEVADGARAASPPAALCSLCGARRALRMRIRPGGRHPNGHRSLKGGAVWICAQCGAWSIDPETIPFARAGCG